MKAAMTGPVREFGSLFGCTPEAIDAEQTLDNIWCSFPKNQEIASLGTSAFLHAIKKPTSDPLLITPEHFRHKEQWHAPQRVNAIDAAFIFLDGPKANQKVRIALWMQENSIEWAFTIRPGKLTLRQYRKMGKPPITRLSSIPPLTKSSRAKMTTARVGGPGVFERFKIIDDHAHYYSEGVNDPSAFDMENRFFAFINKGELVHPDGVVGYETLELADVMMFHRLLKRTQGKSITLINTRSNESWDRWEDFPSLYSEIDAFVENLPDVFVKRIINVANRHRFASSWYQGVVNRWRTAIPGSDDPISQLHRFEERYESLPKKDRQLFNGFVGRAGIGPGTQVKYPFPLAAFHQIVERGRAMGLEILPAMGPARGPYSDNINHRLLPKKWERIARIVQNPHQKHSHFFQLLLKEITTQC